MTKNNLTCFITAIAFPSQWSFKYVTGTTAIQSIVSNSYRLGVATAKWHLSNSGPALRPTKMNVNRSSNLFLLRWITRNKVAVWRTNQCQVSTEEWNHSLKVTIVKILFSDWIMFLLIEYFRFSSLVLFYGSNLVLFVLLFYTFLFKKKLLFLWFKKYYLNLSQTKK